MREALPALLPVTPQFRPQERRTSFSNREAWEKELGWGMGEPSPPHLWGCLTVCVLLGSCSPTWKQGTPGETRSACGMQVWAPASSTASWQLAGTGLAVLLPWTGCPTAQMW